MKHQAGFRPQLQEMEERLVPASYRWHPSPAPGGGLSQLWSSSSNWQQESAIPGRWTTLPTATPGGSDSVFFIGGSGFNLDCHVDVAGGVTVKDVALASAYTSQLVLDNPLTLSGGISTHDSAGGAIVGYSTGSTPVRGILNVTGPGTSLDWTGGHISDITVNVTNQATMFVSTLTFTRNMSGSDIYIGNTSILGWFSGPVNVIDATKNSNIYIAAGGMFSISANQTWGMTTPTNPAYFGVHNAGLVKSTGTATIIGNYDTTATTRLYSGILYIDGLAEQTSGMFELRGGSTIKVGGPDVALRIYEGIIAGQGTVDANLTLGYDGACPPPTTAIISPGILVPPPNNRTIGTLTIVGGFQMFSGTMAIDVNQVGAIDQVVVQGQYAALAGSLFIQIDTRYMPTQHVVLPFLTAPSIQGDFDQRTLTDFRLPIPPANPRGNVHWGFSRTATAYNLLSIET
jgi:hypothetical protein